MIDLGYLGVEKDFSEQLLSALPCKKKINQLVLSQEEIKSNTIHSKKRGNSGTYYICRLKKYSRIMSDTFRNKLRKYDKLLDIIAGLVNYRIMNKVDIESVVCF